MYFWFVKDIEMDAGILKKLTWLYQNQQWEEIVQFVMM